MNKMPKGFDVAIIGAGPAGSSLAIRLATQGYKIALIEEQRFPRDKLCGEFISPECINHFQELGISERIKFHGGAFLQETVFYSPSGVAFSVPSSWFGGVAFGLSRAIMDNELLRRAIELKIDVLTETHITDFSFSRNRIERLTLKRKEQLEEIKASIFVDATGRRRYVIKKLKQIKGVPEAKRKEKRLVAFKAHLLGAKPSEETCEIYFYDGGYGGLSSIENGLCNLCFIVREDQARVFGGDALRLMREVVCSNGRAKMTLKNAEIVSTWHSTTLQSFGYSSPADAENLFAVGDAAAFVDPFTGSGILIALESSKLLSQVIREYGISTDLTSLKRAYMQACRAKFDRRFRYCSLLRFFAFSSPLFVELAAFLFSKSPQLWLKSIAQLTRAS